MQFIYTCTHSAFFPVHESLSQNHSFHLCLSLCLLVHHSFIQYLSITCGVPDTVPSSGNNTCSSISASLSGLPSICHPLSVTDVPSLSCWFVPTQLIKMLQSFSSSPFFCHLTFPLLHQAYKELLSVPEVPSFCKILTVWVLLSWHWPCQNHSTTHSEPTPCWVSQLHWTAWSLPPSGNHSCVFDPTVWVL